MDNIKQYLSKKRQLVDQTLGSYFVDKGNTLFDIMYYSLDHGKRIRPILAIAGYEACGGKDINEIMPIACGLELIHTYSLIHDDLPSMDNDDFRRGRESAHKKFGEATAILSGDGLFAYAYELISNGNGLVAEKNKVISRVSEAVGPKGIVFGQMLDIAAVDPLTPKKLRNIHLNKTAKFIEVSIECGALIAKASEKTIEKIKKGGILLGMLFQYTDDILDVVGERSALGKTPGKDKTAGKITASAVYGLDGARFRAKRYAERAKAVFHALGSEFMFFDQIIEYILNRTF
ncbi:hypothetical protein A2Y85_00200 [candidate division WOR-3 bacterium RBG_13_43_14]|uniref:Polyprenyl synthetase n=1 Tax=candidate division WOR-3 bacterium RBG_13_43_14 TaxID=1802590 RepID=A0A1F4UFK6_UNCW3|nr:MAG: hypothetical protein A2Y85_00200 [candidate division WOR-3 bacterium RBG_13_43_14]